MSAPTVFSLQEVSKIVPPQHEILKSLSFGVFYGAKIAIVGENGAGKSTLLRLIAGEDKEYVGEITYKKDIRIKYLSQEPQIDPTHTVRETVEAGVRPIQALLDRFDTISQQLAEPLDDITLQKYLDEQAQLQDAIEACRGWELEHTLTMAAEALRLPPWEDKISTLSGGEKRRVALCQLLLSLPDVLLLDEPTNHLDAESVAWLEQYLKQFPGTVIVVTHDRYFLDNVTQWILEIDRGRGIPFEGNYSQWLAHKAQRLQHEKQHESAHRQTIQSELEWIQTQPKGRRKKNKARLSHFEALVSKTFQQHHENQELYIPPGPPLGNQVIAFQNLRKSLGEKLLIDGLSATIPKGAIVGITGGNGAGKTTFFKLLMGIEQPDSGEISIGETVQLAYVDQTRDQLDGNQTVWEAISDGLETITVGQYRIASRAYVGRFHFKGPQQQKSVQALSGGERNRVHLAKLLKSGGNVLLLDEPTNDLDVETLRALEEALLAFPGCALVISHDRWFLDRIATHILAFEGNSEIRWFEGSYSEYEKDLLRRLGTSSVQPHRVKYKRLSTA